MLAVTNINGHIPHMSFIRKKYKIFLGVLSVPGAKFCVVLSFCKTQSFTIKYYMYHNSYVHIWCDFNRASSLICGNKMPTRCNRGFYCRSYCLLNMFRASLCPSSGAQENYTVVTACGISCCGFSSSWSGVELRVMRPVCRMQDASCKPDA